MTRKVIGSSDEKENNKLYAAARDEYRDIEEAFEGIMFAG